MAQVHERIELVLKFFIVLSKISVFSSFTFATPHDGDSFEASVWRPPGYRIVPAGNPSGYELERANGVGHSVIDVQGYQVDGKYARAFTFAPASQSLAAEKVGISDEIGVITAYYYAEKLPGDMRAYASMPGRINRGTAAGRQVLQPVFKINPKFHKEPVHSIKVFYRAPSDCPIPRHEQVAVTG